MPQSLGEDQGVAEEHDNEHEWARRELAQAGVPTWAPCGSDEVATPRYYAWVDDDGELRGALVGVRFGGARGVATAAALIDRCEQLLAGKAEGSRETPEDLQQATALLVVRRDGFGNGPLSRPAGLCRPLSDLARFAVRQRRAGTADP